MGKFIRSLCPAICRRFFKILMPADQGRFAATGVALKTVNDDLAIKKDYDFLLSQLKYGLFHLYLCYACWTRVLEDATSQSATNKVK
jgi:hypothetical protein